MDLSTIKIGGEAVIYLYENIDSIPLPDIFDMPEERILKMNNYKKEVDKRMCYAGFELLRYALKKEYGININRKTEVGYTVRGKPYLFSYPYIHFNISHCYPIVMCFVSDEAVGADVQTIVTEDDLELIELIGSSNEIKGLKNAYNPRGYFTRLWTLKESYLKMLGTGLDDELNRYDFGDVNSQRFSALGCDFFSKRMGKYYLSVCKKKLCPYDIEVIKV